MTQGVNTVVKLVGAELRINVPGDDLTRYRSRLLQLKRRAQDPQPAFDAFGEYMLGRIDMRFRRGGVPRWAPLAPSTIADKMRQGYGDKPTLVRTGRLRRSFRARTTKRTLQIINRRSRGGVSLYRVHQEGAPGANIPRRQMVAYGRTEQQRLSAIMRRHLTR